MNNIQQSLPWLQAGWSQLHNYVLQNRVPQALLVKGNAGMGKKQLMTFFAQSVMCSAPDSDGSYCGQCQSCKLFDAGTHPDYLFIQPEQPGKAIGIDVIRQLTAKLSLKPQFDSYRLVIINQADCLNMASANAFLKFLEEPTERTCLILITDKAASLPATISSRCQKLQISVTDNALIKQWLQQQGYAENSDLLVKLAQGSPLLARQLAENNLLTLRNECFQQYLKLAQGKENFVVIAEQWSKFDKQQMEFLLFCLQSWLMDIVKLQFNHQTDQLLNFDLSRNLQEMADRLDLKKIYKYYDFLLLSQQRIDTQLNKQLMFEDILIQWLELNSG